MTGYRMAGKKKETEKMGRKQVKVRRVNNSGTREEENGKRKWGKQEEYEQK